ncbi:MAG TPA: hypothetical protein PLH64_09890 [Anaerolineaceae bacterium]|nr:hypothetical protein [Anaerolineaceae bacterium]
METWRSDAVLGQPTRALSTGVLRKAGTIILVIASEAWRSAFVFISWDQPVN